MSLQNLSDTDFGLALANIATKLPDVAATLGISPAEVTQIQQDNVLYDFVLKGLTAIQDHSKQWTSFKNILRGSTKSATLGTEPVFVMDAIPSNGSMPDIMGRLSKIIARIKASNGYTEAIGKNLGIEAIETVTAKTANWDAEKPVLHVHLVAGRPIIEWKKGHSDGIEIQKSIAGADYTYLDIDLKPHYQDKSPLPPQDQSVTWKYRAIYRLNDERVGQWSDEVSVSVMG